MALSRDEIIEAISQMSVLELNELVKALEEKFGVSAQMMA
ncbi:MAG: 50S ribosomal protein L7/L12, partial [Elusimicrobia bacterium]|nr:50S ribosomal protein L7/L12 [Elusimicrobiota bacterium]